MTTTEGKIMYSLCVVTLTVIAISCIIFGVLIDKDLISILGMTLGFPIGTGIRTILNWDTKHKKNDK